MSIVILICKPWPYSDIRSCCHQSVHAFTSRYDSTLLDCTFLHRRCVCMRYHHFYKVHAYCYSSIIIDSCIATPAEVDQKIHQSVRFLPLTIQLAQNFNLKQEMQQMYYINSKSLVNNVNSRHGTFSRA